MECQICYSSLKSAEVSCLYCNFITCKRCTKRVILDSINQPACMSCKAQWNREFLCQIFGKTWVCTKFKQHRASISLGIQKSMLPDEQPIVARYNDLDLKLKQIEQTIQELYIQKIIVKTELSHIDHGNYSKSIVHVPDKFKQKCPIAECRGFLSTRYKCGSCKTYICPDCGIPKLEMNDSTHHCKDEDIKTVEYFKSQVKACPKCSEGIEKISGCDQMFCTNCKIAFSWKTLEIITKQIHNPHFFEWQQTLTNGEILRTDNPCGNMPNIREIVKHILRSERKMFAGLIDSLPHIHAHIKYYEMENLQVNDYERDKRILRFKYLRGVIDEKQWQSKLATIENNRDKIIERYQIFEMFTATLTDILNNFMTQNSGQKISFTSTLESIENLRQYTNLQLEKYGSSYTCVHPYITESFSFKPSNRS